MSVPVKLTDKVTIDRKKMGVKSIVSLTFEMRSEDAGRAFALRDGLAEAFICAIRKSDEELMR